MKRRLWIIVATVVVLAVVGAGIGWLLGVDRLETVRAVNIGLVNEIAVMVVTTDSPVPRDVIAEIARSEGFLAGRAVSL